MEPLRQVPSVGTVVWGYSLRTQPGDAGSLCMSRLERTPLADFPGLTDAERVSKEKQDITLDSEMNRAVVEAFGEKTHADGIIVKTNDAVNVYCCNNTSSVQEALAVAFIKLAPKQTIHLEDLEKKMGMATLVGDEAKSVLIAKTIDDAWNRQIELEGKTSTLRGTLPDEFHDREQLAEEQADARRLRRNKRFAKRPASVLGKTPTATLVTQQAAKNLDLPPVKRKPTEEEIKRMPWYQRDLWKEDANEGMGNGNK